MEKIKPAISLILRICIAAAFVYAGVTKLINPAEFYRGILNYQIVPDAVAYAGAYILPPLEIVMGLGLLFRPLLKVSLVLISLLTLVFIAALASTIFRGLSVDCGCFGGESQTAQMAILKNIAIITCLAIVYFIETNKKFVNFKGIENHE